MSNVGSACAAPPDDSAESAEEAFRKLEDILGALAIGDDAREALATIRHALYVAHFHAHTDALTGLMNRACFGEALGAALARLERSGEPGALLFVDLDDFKHVNDDLGHAAGDQVLAVTAQRLREAVREGDIVARYGGDEFVVFLERASADAARAIAERAIHTVELPCATQSGTRRITPSVGIALYPEHGRTAEELLRHADRAMYRSKALGGARTSVFAGSAEDAPNKSSASGAFRKLPGGESREEHDEVLVRGRYR